MRNIVYISIWMILLSLTACNQKAESTKEARPITVEKSAATLKELVQKHKGKVLYIDIWASWCGPCMSEMKPAKSLKEHFAIQQPIEFIYINLDKKEARWKNAIQAKSITGTHIFASRALENDLEKNYGAKSIPRYIIFNKNGELINNDAPRPSDFGITEILEDML
ncbi:TlpA family protein disulfide reductase [Cyclobacteriaceae bacterium]|nr:TlpA family protein disulfide reductase [Cyclobacteriaceae bacterium]